MTPHLEQLKEIIELNYHCQAKHVGSSAVVEICGRGKIWQGWVEIFDVACHVPVKRCYAWVEPYGRPMTVLGLPPINSPRNAIRDAFARVPQRAFALTEDKLQTPD